MNGNSSPQPQADPRAYGICVNQDQVLLVRSRADRYDPPLWWLPGGGIDFPESPEEAVIREFLEETNLVVHSPRLMFVSSDVRQRSSGEDVFTVRIVKTSSPEDVFTVRIVYEVVLGGGELAHEVGGTTEEARWFPFDEVGGLNLAPYARRAWEAYLAK